MKRLIDNITHLRDIKLNGFTTSLNLCTHPLIKTRKKTKLIYFAALEYLTKLCAIDNEYVSTRLSQYQTLLVGDDAPISLTPENSDAAIKMIVDDFLKPWKREYRLILLCDIALIVLDKSAIKKAFRVMSKYLNGRMLETLNELLELLFNDFRIPPKFKGAEEFLVQFRINHRFISQQEMRIMVTANMSAGKSTLINALTGKSITRTSQGACTANLCFLFNKPFEDNRLHVGFSPVNLNATQDDLLNVERESVSSIASYFRAFCHTQKRICLIDTPGVNSAMNPNHGKLTRKAVAEENYDKLIYVLSASSLGTDDEIAYLKYIYENVPNEKVIFVLNKLDCFKSVEDSISSSIDGVKSDLLNIGFKDPIICPMSAYFSLLLKMKIHGEIISKQEERIMQRYIEDFSEPEYDLSTYYTYDCAPEALSSDELLRMGYISGLHGLENILYGG